MKQIMNNATGARKASDALFSQTRDQRINRIGIKYRRIFMYVVFVSRTTLLGGIDPNMTLLQNLDLS